MDDHPDPRKSPILHLVLGVPLCVIGLVGSIVWYRQVSLNDAVIPSGGRLGLIGPVILGFFSVIVLIWVLLGAVSLISHLKD